MANPEKCFLAIENVYYRIAFVNTSLGDIFLTDEGVYYLPYTEVVFDGGAIGDVIASALGGGLAHGIGKNAQAKADINYASVARRGDWSVGINERVKRYTKSIFIPEKDITSFDIDRDLIVIHTINEKRFQFQIYQASEHIYKLTSYSKGKKWIDKNDFDRHGFGSDACSPAIFVDALASGYAVTRFSDEMLSRISENNEYIDELWKLFSSRDDQATILGSIAKLPEFFGLKFSERVKKSLSIQQENVKYMGGCILVGIAVVAGLSLLIQSDSGWLLYAVIGLGSFLLITVAYLWVKEIGNLIARRIFLRTHDTPAHQQSAGQGWKRFLAPAAIAAMLAAAAIIFFYGQ